MKENKNKDLYKMFKKQFKVQFIINLISTAAMLLFLLFFLDNKTVVIFIIALIIVFWLYSAFKLSVLWRAIKRMEKTKLSYLEKESSVEANIEEKE